MNDIASEIIQENNLFKKFKIFTILFDVKISLKKKSLVKFTVYPVHLQLVSI